MNKTRNSPLVEQLSALQRITELPIDFDDPIYRQYPGLKLGVVKSVTHYAERIAILAERIINAQPDRPWVLTAPPFNQIPAAANLLCWQVRDLLAIHRPPLPVENIFEHRAYTEDSQGDPLQVHLNYSQLSALDRKAAREQALARLHRVPAFSGASVLFFNDINVTGSQQRSLSRYFAQLGAHSVHWLYLIDVDRKIGKYSPQLEHAINSSGITSFEAFSDVICETDIHFTSKCIWRFLAYDVRQLADLFKRLPPERGEAILDLVNSESLGDIEVFRDSAALLNHFFHRN